MSRTRIHIARITAPAWYVAAAWLLLALFAQVRLLHPFHIRFVEPSLVLVAVAWYAVRVQPWLAAAYGCAAGICEDLLAYHTGGAWTISTGIVALVCSMLSRGFFADSIPLLSTIAFAATLARQLIFWVVMGFEGYPSGLGMMHFREALLEAVLNAVAITLVMWVARRFSER